MGNRIKIKLRKRKEKVADDSAGVAPVRNLRSRGNTKRVDFQESESDDDGSTSNDQKLQKMRKVADDYSVEVVPATILHGETTLFEVKVQESQVFHDALDMREMAISMIDDQKKKQVADADAVDVRLLPFKKRLLTRVDVNKQVDGNGLISSEKENQSSFLAPPPHKFHPRVLEAIRQHGGMKLPVFLFEKKLDSEDVGGCFNRLYLARYDQVLSGLSREESNKVYSILMKNTAASLIVVATDPKGVDYEFQLNWDGVCVHEKEWMRLVAANGLRERDTLRACVYWLGNEFRLALIFQRGTYFN